VIEPLQIRASTALGRIFSYGAQVTSWSPQGLQDALFVSPQAVLRQGTAIRGGIPVVFPWFGAGRRAGMSPSHGFARTVDWHLVEVDANHQADVHSVRLDYELTQADATSPWFPYHFRARLSVAVGSELHLGMTITNTGPETFTYEQALHAYLAVGDVQQVLVQGLDGEVYVDKIDGDLVERQSGDLMLTGPIDRVYQSRSQIRVVDPVLKRSVRIAKERSAQTVIWNPWEAGAEALADLGPGNWRQMLCVEPANDLDSAIALPPGESHCMTMRMWVDETG